MRVGGDVGPLAMTNHGLRLSSGGIEESVEVRQAVPDSATDLEILGANPQPPPSAKSVV